MAPNASSMFSYSQTEPSTDLVNGSSWATHSEGPQNFQDFPDNGSPSGDAEEYLFTTSGQTTPRGSRTDHHQTADHMWTATRNISAPSRSHAMSRADSSRSSASAMTQSSHLSHMENAGNAAAMRNGPQPAAPVAGMDSCLLLDPEAAAVPHMYWSDYNVDMSLNAENSGVFSLTETSPLHVVPAHMHLGTENGFPDNSSPSSWDCFSSSISRTSSPATIDDTWLSAPLSPHSSPDMKCQSPSVERKLPIMSDDRSASASGQMEEHIGLAHALGRRGTDGESARDHALYKNAAPHADGLFHCPWEGQQSCNHKPEKLKCNYDKFVDSHLKPYRCKADSCEGARFSSTACLLRHEREAHGLHGHGDKPFLCMHEGCERAVPGNGFPRQWNLRDHMKRVHNDHGSAGGSPPSATVTQPTKGRKRKTEVPEPQATSSRKATAKSMPPPEPAQTSKPLLDQWLDHRRAVEDMVRGLNKPEDSRSIHQISEVQKRLAVMVKLTAQLTGVPKSEVFPAQGRRGYVSG